MRNNALSVINYKHFERWYISIYPNSTPRCMVSISFLRSFSFSFHSCNRFLFFISSKPRRGGAGERRRRSRCWWLRDDRCCRGGAGRRGSERAGLLPRAARSETPGPLLEEPRGLPPHHRPPADAVEALLPGQDAVHAHVSPPGGHPAGHGAAAQVREPNVVIFFIFHGEIVVSYILSRASLFCGQKVKSGIPPRFRATIGVGQYILAMWLQHKRE